MSRYVCKLHVMGDKQYKPGDEIELDDVEDANELVRLGYLESLKTGEVVQAEPDPDPAIGESDPAADAGEDDKPKAQAKGKK